MSANIRVSEYKLPFRYHGNRFTGDEREFFPLRTTEGTPSLHKHCGRQACLNTWRDFSKRVHVIVRLMGGWGDFRVVGGKMFLEEKPACRATRNGTLIDVVYGQPGLLR